MAPSRDGAGGPLIDPRVEEIWAGARAVPTASREAWLEEQCGGDHALRDEVASLLRHADEGATFFAKLTGSMRHSAEELGRAALSPGTRLGPYVVVREIGRGGMGVVYEGLDPRLDRRVALKVLPPWLAADLGARKRLVAEARAASAIEHPNLATLHDVVELPDESLCLVLAHYEGETLKERLDRGPMPTTEAVDAVRQAARGLAEVHSRGIVHRDVKPANLFLTAVGRVVVLDFGIAKVQGADPTRRFALPGTVAYMAPEQARGDEVDARADVWALGVVLYEAVTGGNPFRRDTDAATLDAVARHEPRRLDAVRSGVPRAVALAAACALAKEPAARFPDAGALASALEGRSAGALRAIRPWSVAALLALMAGGSWFEHGARPTTEARAGVTAVPRVAVLPFEVRGDPSLGYLREGLASLLSVSLDGAGGVRSVDPFTVFERAEGAEAIAPVAAGRIADGLGAERFVLGQVVAAGDRLRIQAFLYDRARGPEPVASVSVEGAVDRIFNMVDEVASQLLLTGHEGPGEELTKVAAMTTGSIDAFKWYLEGDQHFRAGRFSEAVASLERAVTADSTFALAWYRLSEASGWLTDFDREIEAAEVAGRFTDRLPPVERRILRAHLLWPRGEVSEAERLYLEALEARPESADAWYGLGELYFHVNPMRGRSSTEARVAFERSVALSGRERYEALVHLADLAAWEGRFAEYDSFFARLPRDGDFALVYAVQHALITGSESERARAVERLRAAGPVPSLHVARRMGAFTRSPAGALRAARVVVEHSTDARNQAAGRLTAAVLETALGRWPAARHDLDQAELLAAPSARLYRAWLAAHPTLGVPRTELESIRASLESWDPRRPPSRPEALSVDADLHGPLRTYAIGLLSARLGDIDTVRRHAAALARVDSPETQELPRDLGRELEARALALEGRWDEALSVLESTRATRDYERSVRSPFFQMSQARWLRAEILEALGRRREALEWYRVVPQMYFDAVVFQAPAARREEAILASLGEGTSAGRR